MNCESLIPQINHFCFNIISRSLPDYNKHFYMRIALAWWKFILYQQCAIRNSCEQEKEREKSQSTFLNDTDNGDE